MLGNVKRPRSCGRVKSTGALYHTSYDLVLYLSSTSQTDLSFDSAFRAKNQLLSILMLQPTLSTLIYDCCMLVRILSTTVPFVSRWNGNGNVRRAFSLRKNIGCYNTSQCYSTRSSRINYNCKISRRRSYRELSFRRANISTRTERGKCLPRLQKLASQWEMKSMKTPDARVSLCNDIVFLLLRVEEYIWGFIPGQQREEGNQMQRWINSESAIRSLREGSPLVLSLDIIP